jgi:hypothetical protein
MIIVPVNINQLIKNHIIYVELEFKFKKFHLFISRNEFLTIKQLDKKTTVMLKHPSVHRHAQATNP